MALMLTLVIGLRYVNKGQKNDKYDNTEYAPVKSASITFILIKLCDNKNFQDINYSNFLKIMN